MHTKPAYQLGWYLWLVLVALSPASTKVAGAAWFIAIFFSFWLAYSQPKLTADSAETRALYRATDLILWFFVLAFVLRTIAQAYWWDNWEYRHFDARMLFTAIALHIFVRRIPPINFSIRMQKELVLALGLASIAALLVAFVYIHTQNAPTTIIPWSYGMVVFSAVLASACLTPETSTGKYSLTVSWIALAGAVLFLIAISMSGVRGAYFALIWVACIVVYSLRHALSLRHLKSKYFWLSCLAVILGLGLLIKSVPQIYEVPRYRIVTALTEIKGFQNEKRNTSAGLRMHFAEKGMAAFVQKPWIGYGIEQRTQLVNQWGVDVDPLLTDMTHTHNEYLNAVLDYGIFGGATILSYLLGIILAAYVLWRVNVALSVALASFCFATFSTFLTNANGLHNFTSVSLGLALICAVLLFSNLKKPESPS